MSNTDLIRLYEFADEDALATADALYDAEHFGINADDIDELRSLTEWAEQRRHTLALQMEAAGLIARPPTRCRPRRKQAA